MTSDDGDVEEGNLVVGDGRFEVEELEDVDSQATIVRVVILALAVLEVLVALVVDALVRRQVQHHVIDLQATANDVLTNHKHWFVMERHESDNMRCRVISEWA